MTEQKEREYLHITENICKAEKIQRTEKVFTTEHIYRVKNLCRSENICTAKNINVSKQSEKVVHYQYDKQDDLLKISDE